MSSGYRPFKGPIIGLITCEECSYRTPSNCQYCGDTLVVPIDAEWVRKRTQPSEGKNKNSDKASHPGNDSTGSNNAGGNNPGGPSTGGPSTGGPNTGGPSTGGIGT